MPDTLYVTHEYQNGNQKSGNQLRVVSDGTTGVEGYRFIVCVDPYTPGQQDYRDRYNSNSGIAFSFVHLYEVAKFYAEIQNVISGTANQTTIFSYTENKNKQLKQILFAKRQDNKYILHLTDGPNADTFVFDDFKEVFAFNARVKAFVDYIVPARMMALTEFDFRKKYENPQSQGGNRGYQNQGGGARQQYQQPRQQYQQQPQQQQPQQQQPVNPGNGNPPIDIKQLMGATSGEGTIPVDVDRIQKAVNNVDIPGSHLII